VKLVHAEGLTFKSRRENSGSATPSAGDFLPNDVVPLRSPWTP